MSQKKARTGGWKGPSQRALQRPPSEDLLSDPSFKKLLDDGAMRFCRRCLGKRLGVRLVTLPLHAAIERGIEPAFAAEHGYALCTSCREADDADAWIARNLGFLAKGAAKPFVSKPYVIASEEGGGESVDTTTPSREPEN